MGTKFGLTTAAMTLVAALGLSPLANAQTTTDVRVRDGAGNTSRHVRSFDENEAGSGLAVGFTRRSEARYVPLPGERRLFQ